MRLRGELVESRELSLNLAAPNSYLRVRGETLVLRGAQSAAGLGSAKYFCERPSRRGWLVFFGGVQVYCAEAVRAYVTHYAR